MLTGQIPSMSIVSSVRLALNSATLERIPMMLFFRALIVARPPRPRVTVPSNCCIFNNWIGASADSHALAILRGGAS